MPVKKTSEELLELRVTKAHLQAAGALVTLLLSMTSFFAYRLIQGVDGLTESVNRFSTYIETNDLRLGTFRDELTKHIDIYEGKTEKDAAWQRDMERRLIIIEQRRR